MLNANLLFQLLFSATISDVYVCEFNDFLYTLYDRDAYFREIICKINVGLKKLRYKIATKSKSLKI